MSRLRLARLVSRNEGVRGTFPLRLLAEDERQRDQRDDDKTTDQMKTPLHPQQRNPRSKGFEWPEH